MSASSQRRHDRAALPFEVQLTFEVDRIRIPGAEVLDLGPGGLGAWVEDRHAHLIREGAILKELRHDHPEVPRLPHVGRLAFHTLKGQGARPGYIMIGVEFLHPTQAFAQAMNTFLAGLITRG